MSVRQARLDPSGRPLKNAGREATLALAIVGGWIVVVALVLFLTRDTGSLGISPSGPLIGLAVASWLLAEQLVGRWEMVWPSSACGIIGPLSAGLAASLATPELRGAEFAVRISVIAQVSALLMIVFLFRFRLPGLVSPVITFTIVALFLTLYGTDPVRLRELEGFSPRGIVAALMAHPVWASIFGLFGAGALVFARRLDLKGDDFGLAAARPLHLVGCGITALVLGRLASMVPPIGPVPLEFLLLLALWFVAWAWALRLNRIATLFAMHFAMAKPMIWSTAHLMGINDIDIYTWSAILWVILIADLIIWYPLHRISRLLDWTLGPGGRKPPLDRPGIWWRYWPYAHEKT